MTPSPSDRRARGIAMRQARRARILGIRRRVVASALALFVATWLLITMLLISGHDPALARHQDGVHRLLARHHDDHGHDAGHDHSHEHDADHEDLGRERRDDDDEHPDDDEHHEHDHTEQQFGQLGLEQREQLFAQRTDLEPVMSEHLRPDTMPESLHRFDCFGGRCTVIVADGERPVDAAAAAAMSRRALLSWHDRFSRFQTTSEVSALNRDPRRTLTVSPLLARLALAALRSARETGGLVDATLGAEIERAGYRTSLEGAGIPLDVALALAPERAAARPAEPIR